MIFFNESSYVIVRIKLGNYLLKTCIRCKYVETMAMAIITLYVENDVVVNVANVYTTTKIYKVMCFDLSCITALLWKISFTMHVIESSQANTQYSHGRMI